MCGCLLCAPYWGPGPTQACALTRNPTGNLLVLRPMLSPLCYTNQGLPQHLKKKFMKFTTLLAKKEHCIIKSRYRKVFDKIKHPLMI